jgi:hypothetical protein
VSTNENVSLREAKKILGPTGLTVRERGNAVRLDFALGVLLDVGEAKLFDVFHERVLLASRRETPLYIRRPCKITIVKELTK